MSTFRGEEKLSPWNLKAAVATATNQKTNMRVSHYRYAGYAAGSSTQDV